MSLFEYDEKKHERTMMEIGREEGHAAGLAEGEIRKLLTLIIKKVTKGKSIEQIADDLEEDTDTLTPLYESVISHAPDYDLDTIMNEVLHTFK